MKLQFFGVFLVSYFQFTLPVSTMTCAVPDDFLSAAAHHNSVAVDGGIRKSTVDDFGNDRASAGSISVGDDVSGVLAARDIDVMRLGLQAGQTYTLALQSGHLAAPVLMLVSGDNGLPLHSRSELQHSFTFTPEVSGNYYVSASTDAPAGGSFSFKASTLVDDFGATAGTAGHLPLGGVLAGRLGIGGADRDWFGLTLSAGEYYAFTTYSTDLTNTGEFAIGKVFDFRGNVLATSIGTGGVNGNTVGFTPTLGGKYYFEVYSALSTGAAYTVTAQTSSPDDFGDTPETAGRLMEKAPLSGRLSPNDRDSFKLNVVAGNSYVIELVIPRVPDKDGLGYWIAQMDDGMALGKVASNFADSAEFKSLFGAAPTNAQFVDLLYNNVLHRKGDQAGIDFWINSLGAGTRRDDMLASFSESAENQAALVAIIGNGFIYNPYG